MSYRLVAALCMALSILFGGVGFIHGEDKDDKSTAAKKGDDKAKKDDKKEDKDKPLTKDEFDDVMNDIQTAWNKLKINARKKMGDKAAEAADEIAEAATKVLRYDGKVLKGDNKGKNARDQKDFKDWVKALEDAAKDYAKHAKKGDWDKADKAREKINETCGSCHDEYEPE